MPRPRRSWWFRWPWCFSFFSSSSACGDCESARARKISEPLFQKLRGPLAVDVCGVEKAVIQHRAGLREKQPRDFPKRAHRHHAEQQPARALARALAREKIEQCCEFARMRCDGGDFENVR